MKRFFLLILSVFSLSAVSALPGVFQSVPDTSGQFVYYQDLTFNRTSYFGAMYYDESTYAVRYYAPEVKGDEPQEEKDFTIYFSMDPVKKYVDMTGEKITGKNYERNPDIINYLHDMVYELTARRQKAGNIKEAVSLDTDYEQFGGNVKINWDPLVPLFNINSIISDKGEKILVLVTQGQVTSSDDKSFTEFYGIPKKSSLTPRNFKPAKKASALKAEYSSQNDVLQSVKITDQWKKQSDNFWTLEQEAVLSMNCIQIPEDKTQNMDLFRMILRTFMLGTSRSYPLSENTVFSEKKSVMTLTQVFHNSETNTFTTDIKKIYRFSDTGFTVLTLTVFSSSYEENTKYFNKILDSYTVIVKQN